MHETLAQELVVKPLWSVAVIGGAMKSVLSMGRRWASNRDS